MVNSGEILGKLHLHDGCPYPYSAPEPMDNVMEVDNGAYMGVYGCLYRLPEGFQKANDPGVCGTFRYEDQDGPPQFLWDLCYAPHVLNYSG